MPDPPGKVGILEYGNLIHRLDPTGVQRRHDTVTQADAVLVRDEVEDGHPPSRERLEYECGDERPLRRVIRREQEGPGPDGAEPETGTCGNDGGDAASP